MAAYYNEHDPFAAAWLRELITAGQIAEGEVDERDIQTIAAADVRGFTQCHFFAGIGGWSYALRLAGWPDDRPVWTGSCPCQPFSAAGSREGGRDDRHLWPHWARLIGECRPVTVFGEQVESAIAHGWIDAVFDDLEREGYACGAVCLPAASVGAPHIRQRIWFVAESGRGGSLGTVHPAKRGAGMAPIESAWDSERGLMADAGSERRQQVAGSASGDEAADGRTRRHGRESDGDHVAASDGAVGDVGHAEWLRCEVGHKHKAGADESREARGLVGAWDHVEFIPCGDGKMRPVEPGTFPLAHGVSARVGRLRGYGNAIIPQVAAEVIRALMEIRP